MSLDFVKIIMNRYDNLIYINEKKEEFHEIFKLE